MIFPQGHVPQEWPNPTPRQELDGLVSGNGIYAPLQGLDISAPTQGGYQFLDWTDGGVTPHPGVDLNTPAGAQTDCGVLVVAPCAGVVRAVLPWDQMSPGEGNHSWLELDDPACTGWANGGKGATTWLHVDHQQGFLVAEGERVVAGQAIGLCGQSGGWSACHAHVEFVKQRPASWYQWPYAWSPDQVERAYYRPSDWFRQTVALAGELANVPGEVTMAILNGAQTAAVQAVIWGDLWNPEAADFAIPAAWRAEWNAGRWRGAPLGGEEPVPASEDKSGGSFQVFEAGCAVWLPDQPVSWEG